ncbi:hypothetical protein AVEN_24790-1 [Araneus ventricosus]|uniref:Uncharacterized protein n=1 Tax=Araneus ventricosus TaxID=182803 RepID=A0A4Y2TW66_ARAVE|nr:hypothetical protein AVEN_24790-1 [Araneus ventricosus]
MLTLLVIKHQICLSSKQPTTLKVPRTCMKRAASTIFAERVAIRSEHRTPNLQHLLKRQYKKTAPKRRHNSPTVPILYGDCFCNRQRKAL